MQANYSWQEPELGDAGSRTIKKIKKLTNDQTTIKFKIYGNEYEYKEYDTINKSENWSADA